MLDGLDLTQAHPHLDPGAAADHGLGGARPLAFGLGEEVFDGGLQSGEAGLGIV